MNPSLTDMVIDVWGLNRNLTLTLSILLVSAIVYQAIFRAIGFRKSRANAFAFFMAIVTVVVTYPLLAEELYLP